MEFWILYALLSAILVGLANFGVKIIVEKKYDINLFYLYANAISFLLFSWILLFQWKLYEVISNASTFLIILTTINISFLSLSIITRWISLRNIDTVIFYPIYKTISPIIITLISLFLFQESLNPREALGIWVWVFVPLLLITRTENKIQKNLSKWLIFIAITAGISVIASSMPKIAHVYNLDIDTFLLYGFLIGTILSQAILFFQKQQDNTNSEEKRKAPLYFWCILWLLHFGGMYFFIHAMVWNLAIVFTLQSFSILIPIILSIIFYWEHFNLKKGIVIALSIVSILLFI